MTGGRPVHCWVYGSSRKQEMYLYLSQQDGFDQLPTELRQRFGEPRLVLELDLDRRRQLAREDVARVISNLQQRGYHLQMPPRLDAALYHGE